jgi:hypothetical protein
MGKVTRSKSVPKTMQARHDQIVELTDEFCNHHLNDEYRELAEYMAAALCRKRPSPAGTCGLRINTIPWRLPRFRCTANL